MRSALFEVGEAQVLANLAQGNREIRAEKDVRSGNPKRQRRGFNVLVVAAERRELTPEPCRQEDPEVFFPYPEADIIGTELATRTKRTAAEMLEIAKEVCAGCSVRAACLQGAIERGERYGVWAGHDFYDVNTRNRFITGHERSA